MKNNRKCFFAGVLLIFCAMFSSPTLYAQKNTIKTNLAAIHQFGFGLERVVHDKTTLQLEYQRWNQTRYSSDSYSLLGVTTSTDKMVNIKGGRVEVMARRYRRQALNSAFMEAGVFIGKHQITVSETTTDFMPISLLFLDFDNFLNTSTSTKQYKNVSVAGAKFGLGYQKTFGILSMELSGGLNFNAYNSKNIRPSLPLKIISPYGRFSLGFAF